MHSSEIKVVENAFFFPSQETDVQVIFSLQMSHKISTHAVITYILQTMIIIIAIACRDLTSSEID